jgi:DNA-binding response OmpR family regulator
MSNESILVLEADDSLQGLLDAVLRHDGYDPIFVRDGKAAKRLRLENFAVMIVDVSLAPSTLEVGSRLGMGFLHHLQRHDPARLRRVIVLTGLASRDLPRDLPAVAYFLTKPFDIDEVRHAIRACAAEDIPPT